MMRTSESIDNVQTEPSLTLALHRASVDVDLLLGEFHHLYWRVALFTGGKYTGHFVHNPYDVMP